MDKKQQMQSLTTMVSKLRIFKGLNLSQSARLLKVCAYKTYTPSEIIYQVGDPSDEMLILLQGQLKAVGESGTELGEIPPGTCCGEMGVFTGHRRSATIVATSKSSGFVISKKDLTNSLRADPETHVKILQNIVILLSERLGTADQSIETYAGKLKTAEGGMGT